MTSVFKLIFTLTLALVLTHCASVGERSVRISTQQLQHALNKKLTQSFTVLKLFQIDLSHAVVAMDVVSGRMQTTMDAQLRAPMWSQGVNGQLSIVGVPEYNPSLHAVVLSHAEIKHFVLEKAKPELNLWLSTVVKQVSQALPNPLILHHVQAEALTLAGVQYAPIKIEVLADGLQVTLRPQSSFPSTSNAPATAPTTP